MNCLHCGQLVAADSRFCNHCGARLPGAQSAPDISFGATAEHTSNKPIHGVSQIRPWVRYFARMIDVYGFSLIGGIGIGWLFPEVLDGLSELMLGLLLVFMWVFVEATLLASVGTTPGKWLLKIKLDYEEAPELSFGAALERSWKVWWRGMGLGIPLISLFTMVFAYFNLKSEGTTSWDREESFRVSHEKIGAARILLAVLFFIAFLIVLGMAETDFTTQFETY